MATLQDIRTWRGRTVRDRDGDKIGKVEDVYLDRGSGDPEWLAVKTGLFGSRVSFVPIRDAQAQGDDELRVAHAKDLVKDAPNIDPDGELSPEEERRLYQHYGRSDYDEWDEDRTAGTGFGDETTTGRGERTTAGRDREPMGDAGMRDRERMADADARDRDTMGDRTVGDAPAGGRGIAATTGRTGEDAAMTGDDRMVGDARGTGDAMTRSEEELSVGTERREAGRARLRKYVVTEPVEETVPVRREEVRVEREPITDANVDQATAGPEITEAEHEVVLHEEEPVVEKRTVPKERVRLDKDVVTDEETVSGEVRKERIEAEGDTERRP